MLASGFRCTMLSEVITADNATATPKCLKNKYASPRRNVVEPTALNAAMSQFAKGAGREMIVRTNLPSGTSSHRAVT